MIKGVAHVCFTVSNLEQSTRFYRDGLGLKAAFEFRRPTGELFGQYFHVGERTFLELFEGQLAAAAEGQRFRHFCLEVDDMPATVRQLRERGVTVSDPKLGSDQSWQAWIDDPDGNRIELHQYTAESKQGPHLA